MATTLVLTLHTGETPRRRPPRPHLLHPSLYPHLHSLGTHQTLDPTTRATATPHANRAHASCDDGCRGLAIAAWRGPVMAARRGLVIAAVVIFAAARELNLVYLQVY